MFNFLKKKNENEAELELEAERGRLLDLLETLYDSAMEALRAVYHARRASTPLGVTLAKRLKEDEAFRQEFINSLDIDEDGDLVCPALARAYAKCEADRQRRRNADDVEFGIAVARLKEAYFIRKTELLNTSLTNLPEPGSFTSFMDIAGVHEYLQSYE